MKFKIPFLQNVRRGLATNSSSSHSLVYFSTDRPDHDTSTQDVDRADFGWDLFKLRTRREKLTYALVSILQAAGQNIGWTDGDREARDAVEEYVKKWPHLADVVKIAIGGYIDHQSVESNPQKLIDAALDPKVEIWGGNDNGGDPFDSGYPPGYVKHERLGW